MRDRMTNRLLIGALPLLMLLAPRIVRADAIVEGAVLPIPVKVKIGKLADCAGKGSASTRAARRVGRILAPRDTTGQRV